MGIFQRLDPDRVYFLRGVFPVGASSVSPAFKRPQRVASGAWQASFFSRFVLIDSHFLSLGIDLFRILALMQAGREEEVAELGEAPRITPCGTLPDWF